MPFPALTAGDPDRRQSMKKIMLVVAILGGSISCASAGEAFSDPSDYRERGVMNDSSTAKLQMRDADPFQLRMPGVPVQPSARFPMSGSEAPMQTANSLPQDFLDPAPARGPGRATLLTEQSGQNQRLRRSN